MTDPEENQDPDVFAAFNDYQADVSAGERYGSYAEYVDSSKENYEHLLRTDGSDPEHPEWREDVQFWLTKLNKEYERLHPLCGACGTQHQINAPAQCNVAPGVRVFVELWVSSPEVGGPEDPQAFVRDRVLRDCEIAHSPILSILDVYVEIEDD